MIDINMSALDGASAARGQRIWARRRPCGFERDGRCSLPIAVVTGGARVARYLAKNE
jgi:hypothetical protein